MKPLPPLTAHDAKVREQFQDQFFHIMEAADAQAKRRGIHTLLPPQTVLMLWITEKLHERDKLHEKLGEPSGLPEPCRYCLGKGSYSRFSSEGKFVSHPCSRCKTRSPKKSS